MPSEISALTQKIVDKTPVLDIHTHLYAPAFSDLLLYGLDELLIYHYNVAEAFRFFDFAPEAFFARPKAEQAQLIWDELFVKHSPLSEAARGVVTALNRLGIDPRQKDLTVLRSHFAGFDADAHVTRCMELAGVSQICMTNSPFDPLEIPVWEHYKGDDRFLGALRIDPLLVDWENVVPKLQGGEYGDTYDVQGDFSSQTYAEIQRFLRDWSDKMSALYVMVSLPPDFVYPSYSPTSKIIENAVVPFCRESGLPFALMMGVKRGVNPALQLAGDGVGRSDLTALQNLCAQNLDVKFLATVLSRENQHELAVMARKFGNLHVFGCWWFSIVPTLMDEITRMRLELLGPSFTPQHSDARVMEQVIYKWEHTREVVGRILGEKYEDLATRGWVVSEAEIERDVQGLFGGEFKAFLAR
ncbi:glucuronate isomerase [bacterium]|nr:MAG: glucuronate isomerase [bacterium]